MTGGPPDRAGESSAPRPESSRRIDPPRDKTAIVIWIALYPAVVAALSLLRPFIRDWPIPLQALALTVVVIPVAVWGLIPFVQGRMRAWLER